MAIPSTRSIKTTPTNPLKKRPFWKRVLRGLVFLFVGFHIYCLIILLYLKFFPPLFTTVQLQRSIESAFEGNSRPTLYAFRPMAQISPHLQHAVVAAEDTRFYEHNGIDWDALEKAMTEKRNIQRGGSTLSQQLVKNLFFTTNRSYIRKALEFTITPLTELILDKDRILEIYINVVEWGDGIFGAEAAAHFHYHTSALQLTRDQSARLAACLPAPLTRKPQGMNRYARIISGRMNAMGY
jgi:monofunctional biosynthetic peptidoglycan transglycosylase